MVRERGVWTRYALWCVPALVALCAHGVALGSDWVLHDDRELILEHAALADWSALPRLLFQDHFAHTGQVHGYYRPLLLGSLFWDRQWFGLNPVGFHATNLGLHAVTSVAVAALGFRLGLSRAFAVAAGCLFAALPVHAEVVGWVVDRCDGIATAGVVVALLAHLRGRPWIAAVALGVGLGGKESAAAAVPLAALLAWAGWHPPGASRRQAWMRAAVPVAIVGVLYLVARWVALDAFVPPPATVPVGVERLPLLDRLPVFAHAAARMWGSIVAGAGLCTDHSGAPWWRYADRVPAAHGGWALGVLLGSVVVFTYSHLHRRPLPLRLAALGLVWPVVSWLPVSQIVPLKAVQADRFCTLASVGWALALADILRWSARLPGTAAAGRGARLWALAVAAAFTGAYGHRAWDRHAAYDGAAAHAADVLARYPQDAQAWNRFGIAADEARDDAAAERAYREAVRITRDPEAVRGRPSPLAFMNLGTFLLTRGRPAEAQEWLEAAAARTRRPSRKLRWNLARLYSELGDVERAAGLYTALVRDYPGWDAPHRGLGVLWARAGRPAQALNAFANALELDPDHPGSLLGLAEAHVALGDAAEARAAAARVLAVYPRSERAQAVLAEADRIATPRER